jgi:hypothetical protein
MMRGRNSPLRRRKMPNQNKTRHIQVVVTEDEYEKMIEAAASYATAQRANVGQWVRALILKVLEGMENERKFHRSWNTDKV